MRLAVLFGILVQASDEDDEVSLTSLRQCLFLHGCQTGGIKFLLHVIQGASTEVALGEIDLVAIERTKAVEGGDVVERLQL